MFSFAVSVETFRIFLAVSSWIPMISLVQLVNGIYWVSTFGIYGFSPGIYKHKNRYHRMSVIVRYCPNYEGLKT